MEIIAATIQEWRELGFHYDCDNDRCVWTITGSVVGLARFADGRLADGRTFARNWGSAKWHEP